MNIQITRCYAHNMTITQSMSDGPSLHSDHKRAPPTSTVTVPTSNPSKVVRSVLLPSRDAALVPEGEGDPVGDVEVLVAEVLVVFEVPEVVELLPVVDDAVGKVKEAVLLESWQKDWERSSARERSDVGLQPLVVLTQLTMLRVKLDRLLCIRTGNRQRR